MRSARFHAWLAQRPLLQWLREELVLAPLEPILHPSPRRLWWLGLSFFSGNALFAWIWSAWLPQPYENLPLRVMASLLGYSLMTRRVNHDPSSRLAQRVFGLVFWVELPVLFSWMYLCNSGSTVWLATMAAMVLIYYHVTDWRLATLGTITGGLLAFGAFMAIGPAVPLLPPEQRAVHAVVFAFAWSIALVLNLSSANLRREQLSSTLTTIGIMAHELRTPLSTAALLGDAIQLEVQRQPDNPRAQQLDKLALRLHALVRNMNHQIDTQIANAKLLQLPRYTERVWASKVVQDVVVAYPYQSSRQRDCVKVIIHDDFSFRSSATQFSQVLDNLIKNALHSLMAADSKYPAGALRIEVGHSQHRGRIIVADEGMGIDAALLPQIFKPFFSSNRGTGHGLGLAFCQQVVQSAGGNIHVKSEFAVGAVFTIELPMAP
ncbi:HAMP domain-containing sensor histidine kinase [Polaromonas sp. JS666]|uniref:sensor histidine kinase n=1 Tax=Polaromonas sp. (strain JS666 / ATCC BAA-500) TaxID=296591 RepID=UPI00088F94B2|nr:HAMP domain-containing sensor histidine kinase [Polaromonas sp. JS666]SDN00713.1 Signal transduction histidine kinase [Polaromonas sp. JS666]